MGGGKNAVFPSSSAEQGQAAKAAQKAHRAALLAYLKTGRTLLAIVAGVDGVLAVWLWLAATYEPSCAEGDGGPACWTSVAVNLVWPAPAADDLWHVASVCALLRFLALVAGLVALQVKAAVTRRTPRDFLLRTEDERLVALLPELFDAGKTINRNAQAADIREMFVLIAQSLNGPTWVAGHLSVWVDSCARPLADVADMPSDAHLKLCTVPELAAQVRNDSSPPQRLGRQWAKGLGVLCLANAVWFVMRPEFSDTSSYLTVLLLWQVVLTCGVELAHLMYVGFRGDALRHTVRTGGFIAWEFFASTAVVLAAAQCGSSHVDVSGPPAAGSGSDWSTTEISQPQGFFCYIDGGPVSAEFSDWQWRQSHIDAAAISLIRAGCIAALLVYTDFVDQRRWVGHSAVLCGLSCVAPVAKAVLWSTRDGGMTLSELCLAGTGLALGVVQSSLLGMFYSRAKPVMSSVLLRRGPPIPRRQGKWERRCRWFCAGLESCCCAIFEEHIPPPAPAILYRPGFEMKGPDGRWYIVELKGKKGAHVWELRDRNNGQWMKRCRAVYVYICSRAIICGYPLCQGYAEERAKNCISAGDRAFEAGRYRQAIPLYEEGLPVLTRTKWYNAKLVARVHNDIGICQLALRDEVEAECSFRESIATIKRLPPVKRMPEWDTEDPNEDALFNLGSQLQRRGELKAARPYLEEALDVRPTYVKARLNLAVIHAELGDTAMAKHELQQVVDQEPHNTQARIHRVLLRMNELGPVPKVTSRSVTKIDPADLSEMRAELDATVDGDVDNPEVAHLLACIVHAQALLLITPGFPSNVVERAQLSAVLLEGYEMEEPVVDKKEVKRKEKEKKEKEKKEKKEKEAKEKEEKEAKEEQDAKKRQEEQDAKNATTEQGGAAAPPAAAVVKPATADGGVSEGGSGEPRRLIMDVDIDGIRTEINEAGERTTIYDLEVVEHGFNRQQPFKLSRTADGWLALFKQVKAVAMANCNSDDPEAELRDLLSWLQKSKRHVTEDCAEDSSVFSLAAVARRHDALVDFLKKCPDLNESSRPLIMDFLPRPIVFKPEKKDKKHRAPEPEPEPEPDGQVRIKGSFMSGAVNFLERKTGKDLDGDGDVGVDGSLIKEPEPEAKFELSISHEAEDLLELAVVYYETALRLQPVHVPADGMERKLMMPFGRLARLGRPLALDTISEHRHHMRTREQAFTKLGLTFALASLGRFEPAEAWCTQALRAFLPVGFLELPAPYRIHVHHILGRPEHWPHRPQQWRERCVGHLHQLIDLKPDDAYRDALDLLRHWHDRQGDEATAAEYGKMWQEAQKRDPDAVPPETDPILSLRHCYLAGDRPGVAPPEVRPLTMAKASDGATPKKELMALIVAASPIQEASGTDVARRATKERALKADLQLLKMSELCERAEAAGVSKDDIEEATTIKQMVLIDSDVSDDDGSDGSHTSGEDHQPLEPEPPPDRGLAAMFLNREAGIDFFETRRKARSVHAHLTPAEQECLDLGPPVPEKVFDKLKDVLVARGIKGLSNFQKKLRLSDQSISDDLREYDEGELSEVDFMALLKAEKLGLTPSELKVLFDVFDLDVEDEGGHRLDYEDLYAQVCEWEIIPDAEPDLLELLGDAKMEGTSAEYRHQLKLGRRKVTRSDLSVVEDQVRTRLVEVDDENLRALRKGRILRRKERARAAKKKYNKYATNSSFSKEMAKSMAAVKADPYGEHSP